MPSKFSKYFIFKLLGVLIILLIHYFCFFETGPIFEIYRRVLYFNFWSSKLFYFFNIVFGILLYGVLAAVIVFLKSGFKLKNSFKVIGDDAVSWNNKKAPSLIYYLVAFEFFFMSGFNILSEVRIGPQGTCSLQAIVSKSCELKNVKISEAAFSFSDPFEIEQSSKVFRYYRLHSEKTIFVKTIFDKIGNSDSIENFKEGRAGVVESMIPSHWALIKRTEEIPDWDQVIVIDLNHDSVKIWGFVVFYFLTGIGFLVYGKKRSKLPSS